MVRKKVLVVDDDEVIREFLLFNLEDIGYEVHVASDGVDAVMKVIAENAIDFVILDLMMPNLNGINALKILRQLKPNLPVVACTGYLNTEELMVQAENHGVVGCLSKPFSFEKLENILRAHC